MRERSYLVDGKQAVQGFLAAKVLHVCSGRVAPIVDSSLDDILSANVRPVFNGGVLGRKVPQLLQHPLLTFHVNGVGVVMVVVDGEVLGISQELVQLLEGILAALL